MGQQRVGVNYEHVQVEMLILLLPGFGFIEENRNLILKLKFIMLLELGLQYLRKSLPKVWEVIAKT